MCFYIIGPPKTVANASPTLESPMFTMRGEACALSTFQKLSGKILNAIASFPEGDHGIAVAADARNEGEAFAAIVFGLD